MFIFLPFIFRTILEDLIIEKKVTLVDRIRGIIYRDVPFSWEINCHYFVYLTYYTERTDYSYSYSDIINEIPILFLFL